MLAALGMSGALPTAAVARLDTHLAELAFDRFRTANLVSQLWSGARAPAPIGGELACHVLSTSAKELITLIKTIPRPRYLCLEEGTQSDWLYEMLSPHVDKLTVVALRQQSRGPKDDRRDAFKQADDLRTNSIKSSVFKNLGRYGLLRELAGVFRMQVQNSVRVQNRIHALYRSRGLDSPGQALFDKDTRQSHIEELPHKKQPVADLLLREYDAVQPLRADAEKQMVREARRHHSVNCSKVFQESGRSAQLRSFPSSSVQSASGQSGSYGRIPD